MEQAIVPKKIYVRVWAALLVLLGLTVGVAYLQLGFLNTFVSISIALVKALIIAIFFMHLSYSPRLVWVFAGAGFFWLLLLFGFSFGDYMTRSWLPPPSVWLP